jgi:hypothetical protein
MTSVPDSDSESSAGIDSGSDAGGDDPSPETGACRKDSGFSARDASRRSIANAWMKVRGSAPSAITTSMSPRTERIRQLLDEESFEEWFGDLRSKDPLEFKDRKRYPERLVDEQRKTGLTEACLIGRGYMRGRPPGIGDHRLGLHHGKHGIGRRREADAGPSNVPPNCCFPW